MIEINLQKLDRGTHEGKVKYTRNNKTFWRKQRVGKKDKIDDTSTRKVAPPKSIPTKVTPHDKIINRIQDIMDESGEGSRFSSTVMKEPGNIYAVNLMLSYTSGSGIGSMGSMSVLEVNYRNKDSAQKLVDEIKTMKPNKPKKIKKSRKKVNNSKFKELDDMDFDGLSDMVNVDLDRVSATYEIRNMNADDVLTSIEYLIPRDMIRDNKITLIDEFVDRVFNSYKSKYGDKITGNKQITRRTDYYAGIYE